MFKHVLIATDGSDAAAKAVTQGLTLAKALGAKATALTVSEPFNFVLASVADARQQSDAAADYEACAKEAAERCFWLVQQTAKRLGLVCTALHVKHRHPAEAILETAKAEGCDLIAIASHGRRGLANLILGSQTARVLALTSTAVLVCR
jgi:nucleotide-binding universal stress UspA family protein